MPRLEGAHAVNARAVGDKAVVAHWRMGDNALLTIGTNLGADASQCQCIRDVFFLPLPRRLRNPADAGRLEPYATVAVLAA